MSRSKTSRHHNDSLSVWVYSLLLFSYPKTFRSEYGPHMLQVFRDCYRAQSRTREAFAVLNLWLRTMLDLVVSAPKEHLESERPLMKNLGRDLIAVISCVAIIVLAFFLLSYGRRHEVTGILVMGRFLDALVTAGVLGNLIVFLLVKVTRMNPFRIALWSMVVVNGLLLAIAELLGRQVDPGFGSAGLVPGYVFSFLFWFSLHWIWSKGSRQLSLGGEQ